MSLYYFHIRNGLNLVLDEEGTECSDLIAMQIEAQASARDLLRVELLPFSSELLPSIEVEDEDGNAVGMASARACLHE